eukprot:Skav230909  [mRNA]  locus=scaffold2979:64341:65900:+ [translate_table: standard]
MVVGWFVLENVDLELGGPDANYTIIIESLESMGYQVSALKIIATDFGVPQRRVRLYICGVSKSKYPNFDMSKVATVIDLFKLKTQDPVAWMHRFQLESHVDFMLRKDSPSVMRELQRRRDKSNQDVESPEQDEMQEKNVSKKSNNKKRTEATQATGAGEKWKSQHMELAEKRSLVS